MTISEALVDSIAIPWGGMWNESNFKLSSLPCANKLIKNYTIPNDVWRAHVQQFPLTSFPNQGSNTKI